MARNFTPPSNPILLDTQLPEVALKHHGETLFGPMKEWQARGQIPPVLLLTGQPGIGKRRVAHFLAQWVQCQNAGLNPSHPPLLHPCNQCSSCLKTLAGNGVDLTEITADSDDDSGATSGPLKIDQFRKMKASIGFGAHEGTYKIVLIPYADRMTLQAANSVLKILEETPPGWIFYLTATDATLLLPTLVSRCQVLRLKPFSQAQVQELLQTSVPDPERRKICASLAQGSWNRALDFAAEDAWQQRKFLFQFLKDPASVIPAFVDWASQEPAHFEILIDLLEQLTSELIRWSASPGAPSTQNYPWVQFDGKEALAAHAERVYKTLGGILPAQSFWLARAERIAVARQEATAPLNRKLLIQDILLPWMGVMA